VALKRAVFLDKDGTLVENVPYNVERARIVLAPGAVQALRLLAAQRYRFIVVSNQPGVALGHFPIGALAAVADHLADLFAAHDLMLDGCYWCPHHPQGSIAEYTFDCTCRKPLPGLLRAASHEHGIDLSASWLVGDILDDVEAGRRAGCRTALLNIGNETEWRGGSQRTPDVVASSLLAAAHAILQNTRLRLVAPGGQA
jgi:histidinol-phosphate phosphatase family protein